MVSKRGKSTVSSACAVFPFILACDLQFAWLIHLQFTHTRDTKQYVTSSWFLSAKDIASSLDLCATWVRSEHRSCRRRYRGTRQTRASDVRSFHRSYLTIFCCSRTVRVDCKRSWRGLLEAERSTGTGRRIGSAKSLQRKVTLKGCSRPETPSATRTISSCT
jgi:hypothetical protein